MKFLKMTVMTAAVSAATTPADTKTTAEQVAFDAKIKKEEDKLATKTDAEILAYYEAEKKDEATKLASLTDEQKLVYYAEYMEKDIALRWAEFKKQTAKYDTMTADQKKEYNLEKAALTKMQAQIDLETKEAFGKPLSAGMRCEKKRDAQGETAQGKAGMMEMFADKSKDEMRSNQKFANGKDVMSKFSGKGGRGSEVMAKFSKMNWGKGGKGKEGGGMQKGGGWEQKVRPACVADHCCGVAKAADATAEGAFVEVCGSKFATTVSINDPKDALKAVTWNFACIEGSKNIIASAALIISSAYLTA